MRERTHLTILPFRILEAEVRQSVSKNQVSCADNRVVSYGLSIDILVNLHFASLTFRKNDRLALFINHNNILQARSATTAMAEVSITD